MLPWSLVLLLKMCPRRSTRPWIELPWVIAATSTATTFSAMSTAAAVVEAREGARAAPAGANAPGVVRGRWRSTVSALEDVFPLAQRAVEAAFLAVVFCWFSSRISVERVCRNEGNGIWNGRNERR